MRNFKSWLTCSGALYCARRHARLRNGAHVVHVAETEEGRRGGSGHEQEPSPNLESLSQ